MCGSALALLAGVLLLGCAQQAGPSSVPEVIRVDANEIVLAWEGGANAVEYWPLGKPHLPSAAVDEADTRAHEIRIAGLAPGSHYSYRIKDTDDVYHVQTAPLPSGAFSFLLFEGITSAKLLRHVVSDDPSFMLSTAPLTGSTPDPYADLRPFVLLYDTAGNTAAYLRRQPTAANGSGHRLEWGSLILAVSDDLRYLQEQINTLPPGFTLGFLTTEATATALDFAPLHKHLESASTPPVFGMMRDAVESMQKNDVRLVAVGAPRTLFEVTVTPESAYMTAIPTGVQTVLRPAPVSSKRTCAECRRLADSGAYLQSVAAYLAFIESNATHHLIDDAFFEVANIYDEKLFDFGQAIHWYAALRDTYPRSTLTPFAKERLSYLGTFLPEDFPLLEKFERTRRVTYFEAEPAEKKALVAEVLALTDDFAGSALVPEMLYWAGNQLRQTNATEAIATYRRLVGDYPTHANAANAIYAIAETLYDARRYRAARDAYTAALTELPARASSIRAQIARCTRNILRDVLLWAAAALLLAMVALSLRRWRFHRRRLYAQSALFAAGLATLLSLFAWTIRHQFESPSVRHALVFGAGFIAALVPSLVNPIVCAMGLDRVRGSVLAAGLGAVAAISALYILLYFAFEHYLTLFGL